MRYNSEYVLWFDSFGSPINSIMLYAIPHITEQRNFKSCLTPSFIECRRKGERNKWISRIASEINEMTQNLQTHFSDSQCTSFSYATLCPLQFSSTSSTHLLHRHRCLCHRYSRYRRYHRRRRRRHFHHELQHLSIVICNTISYYMIAVLLINLIWQILLRENVHHFVFLLFCAFSINIHVSLYNACMRRSHQFNSTCKIHAIWNFELYCERKKYIIFN